MELIPLPNKLNYEDGENPNEGIVTLEPCYRGYGTTVGNALRRVLLSSLPGAAVKTVKIKGVDHEFSSIPNVREDVIDIILELKKLSLRVFSDEPVTLKLNVKGKQEVTGADIEANSDVEITNPELVLFTTTDKAANIEMELVVAKGVGFEPTEAREKEKLAVGEIAIDSIFTPIKDVALKVENVRVGQMTNYEKMVLKILTDGTVTPKEAVEQATNILISHFHIFIQDQAPASDAGEGGEA